MDEKEEMSVRSLKDAAKIEIAVKTKTGCQWIAGKRVAPTEKKRRSLIQGSETWYGAILVTAVPSKDPNQKPSLLIQALRVWEKQNGDDAYAEGWHILTKKSYKWGSYLHLCDIEVFEDGTYIVRRLSPSAQEGGYELNRRYTIAEKEIPYITMGYASNCHDIRVRDHGPEKRNVLASETIAIIASAGLANRDGSQITRVSELERAIRHPRSAHGRVTAESRSKALSERLNGHLNEIVGLRGTAVTDCGKWVVISLFGSIYGDSMSTHLALQYKKANGDFRANVLPSSPDETEGTSMAEGSVLTQDKILNGFLCRYSEEAESAIRICRMLADPKSMETLMQVKPLSYTLKSLSGILCEDFVNECVSDEGALRKAVADYAKTQNAYPATEYQERRYSWQSKLSIMGRVLKYLMRALIPMGYKDMTYEATAKNIAEEVRAVDWAHPNDLHADMSWGSLPLDVAAAMGLPSDRPSGYEEHMFADSNLKHWIPRVATAADALCPDKWSPDYSKTKPWQQCFLGKEVYYGILAKNKERAKKPWNPKDSCDPDYERNGDNPHETVGWVLNSIFGIGSSWNKPCRALYAHYAPLIGCKALEAAAWYRMIDRYGSVAYVIRGAASQSGNPMKAVADAFSEASRECGYRSFINGNNPTPKQLKTLLSTVPDALFVGAVNALTAGIWKLRMAPIIKGRPAKEADEVLSIYDDYLRLVTRMRDIPENERVRTNWPTKLSDISQMSELQHLHDEANRIVNEWGSKAAREKAKAKDANWERIKAACAKDIEFSDADTPLMIVLPKSLNELVTEGIALHHCVGSYVDSVAAGKEIIAFVRRKDAPETPLLTVDLAQTGEKRYAIRQVHGNYNSQPKDTPDAMRFLSDWAAKKTKIDASTISETYGALCHQ